MNTGKIEAYQMNLNRFIFDEGVEIAYYNPSQVREIPIKKGSVRGYIFRSQKIFEINYQTHSYPHFLQFFFLAYIGM